MIQLRYIYTDGFTNRVNLAELFGRGRLLIEHFARVHGGILRVEVPDGSSVHEHDLPLLELEERLSLPRR